MIHKHCFLLYATGVLLSVSTAMLSGESEPISHYSEKSSTTLQEPQASPHCKYMGGSGNDYLNNISNGIYLKRNVKFAARYFSKTNFFSPFQEGGLDFCNSRNVNVSEKFPQDFPRFSYFTDG